jgi:nucleoside-diphosphate-sugar epimerase
MTDKPGRNQALVTGAAGFLGSHLTRALLADGWKVAALVRPGADLRRLEGAGEGLEVVEADVTDLAAVSHALRSIQPAVVHHLAGDTSVRRFGGEWEVVARAIDNNLSGTLNLVRAIAEAGPLVECLVRAGGLEEYGAGPAPADEAQREQPTSPYGASQAATTHWCQMLQPQLSFSIVNLRPALVYGPGQGADFLIPALIRSLLDGEPFAISDGTQIRDYIHVDDVIDGFRRAAERATTLRGAVINISSGEQYRVGEVARLIAETIGRPDLLKVAGAPRRAGDLDNVSGLNALAARLLDWRPKVGLADGLARTIDWFRTSGA